MHIHLLCELLHKPVIKMNEKIIRFSINFFVDWIYFVILLLILKHRENHRIFLQNISCEKYPANL